MNLALIASKINACKYILKGQGKPSFSQVGEDRILDYLFQSLGISKPSYLDIGANEPVHGSNTYFFYHRGSSGVCIEPEPSMYQKFKSVRERDTCLNIGIGLTEETSATLYVYPPKYSGWNTFSKEEVDERKKNGYEPVRTIQIPLKNINQIIAQHCKKTPDFLSIDVEGLDFDILRSLDFGKYSPTAIVVETLRFGDTSNAQKRHDIIDFMLSKGYKIYADTFVNTIFLKN